MSSLTTEQRARIEKNRLAALERLKQFKLNQQISQIQHIPQTNMNPNNHIQNVAHKHDEGNINRKRKRKFCEMQDELSKNTNNHQRIPLHPVYNTSSNNIQQNNNQNVCTSSPKKKKRKITQNLNKNAQHQMYNKSNSCSNDNTRNQSIPNYSQQIHKNNKHSSRQKQNKQQKRNKTIKRKKSIKKLHENNINLISNYLRLPSKNAKNNNKNSTKKKKLNKQYSTKNWNKTSNKTNNNKNNINNNKWKEWRPLTKANVFNRLSNSKFRSKFKLGKKEINIVHTKADMLDVHAFKFIQNRLSEEYPLNDGKQTPMKGHPVFIAQHATATCCRSCLSKWHYIPKGIKLTNQQMSYMVEIILHWINLRCPKKK